MNDQKVIAEISTTLTISGYAFPSFEGENLLHLKQRADRQFDHYFQKLYPYITKIETEIERGNSRMGYTIRVHITAPLDVVQAFHKKVGVHGDISPEQIRYRPIELSQVEREWL